MGFAIWNTGPESFVIMMTTQEIQIRDPFIVPDQATRRYWLFGSTSEDCWRGEEHGLNCYHSPDLLHWEGPLECFRRPDDFWGTKHFWAPEVSEYKGAYYMFVSFTAPRHFRGTQVLRSETLGGPYLPWSPEPLTPAGWQCLDGSLFIETDGTPWMVFCHEWRQVCDGGMWAIRLREDLRTTEGRPVFLFHASEGPWVARAPWPEEGSPREFPCYVTDGPWLHRTHNGKLLMLWSSGGENGYAMGQAVSESGHVTGPWHHIEKPIWSAQGGHGMLFKTFEGQLMLTFHTPNKTPNERAQFLPVRENSEGLIELE